MLLAVKKRPDGGSSPRMRGALRGKEYMCVDPGIIPADAGSTVHVQFACAAKGDHPRGCGEHAITRSQKQMDMGSSPRMRGAQPLRRIPLTSVRIIPADAGSTNSHNHRSGTAEDHPRGCGEHIMYEMAKYAAQGSSPRMRGARHAYVVTDF